MRKVIGAALMALALNVLGPVSGAQQYEPSVGQEGKDVIWVPTPEELVSAMLDLARVGAGDCVIDLGSGDGRIVIAAAKRGAQAVGYEFNPDMVKLSRQNAEKAGVADRAAFVNADLFTADLGKATVVTLYLLPQLNLKLRPALLELKPGTRIVSHAFSMGDWAEDKKVEKEGRTAYLWIVPAKVEGTWAWGDAELRLTQSFQTFKGSLRTGGHSVTVNDGRLEGSRIRFSAGAQEYEGRVNGRSIEGTVREGGRDQKWSAALR